MTCVSTYNEVPIVTEKYYRSEYVETDEEWTISREEIEQFEDEVYDCFHFIMQWTEDNVLEDFDEYELEMFSMLFDECMKLYTFACIPLVRRYVSNRICNTLQCAYNRLDIIAMNSQPTTKMVREILAKIE